MNDVRELLERAAPTDVSDLDLVRAKNEGSRRRTRRKASAASALVAAVAGVTLLAGVVVQPFGEQGRAWAAALVAAAEDAPRVLVTEPGWQVVRADVYGTDGSGEVDFRNGDAVLQVRWRPADAYPDLLEDRTRSSNQREQVKVLGNNAVLLHYRAPDDYTTLMREGEFTIEARGQSLSYDVYRDLLAGLNRVDVDRWLSAMPASVVQVSDRAATVQQMLADIPTPDGFDAAALQNGPLRERYQLGAVVAGSAACAWIDQWVQAQQEGDAAGAATAVDAMASSRDWKILREMNESGAYPDEVWALADAMANDGTLPYADDLTVQNSYEQSLGCDRFAY